MKKILLLSSLIMCCSLSILAQPKLTIIGGNVYDWHDVKPTQSPLKAEIKLKNEGNELLKIAEVKPSCGCTTAPLDKTELEPGDVATLSVTFNVSSSTGTVSKSIAITSNDPKSKQYLEIKANVVRAIILKPYTYLPFKNLQIGKESTSTLFIKNNADTDITFSDITIDPPKMQIDLPQKFVLKPGEEIKLTGIMIPKTVGYQTSTVTIKTSHPDFPELKIQSYGTAAESPYFENEKPKSK